MLTTFTCPKCTQSIEADASMCGGQAACPGCSESVTVPALEIGPGTTIGGFQLDALLGKGGMGEVFKATQISMDREVAVKILPASMTGNSEAVQRFLKEARLSARLEHPNIVTVHDAGEDNGCYYYAMSYVRGMPLDERLTNEGTLSEKEALSIIISVAEALDFAWQRHQMLHRDIKPANIMLDEQGTPKVLDLGLAKTALEDQSLTMTGMIVGTPYHMSPEQARGGAQLDCRSDIYSLGSTLYHLLCGSRPFESESIMAVLARLATEEPPPLRSIRSDVSENCARVVQVMMSKDIADRYIDYVPLIKDLKRIRANKRPLGPNGNGIGLPDLPQPGAAAPTIAKKATGAPPPAKSKKGLWIGIAAAAMLFLMMAAAIGGRKNQNKQPPSPPPTTTTVAQAPPENASPKPKNKLPKRPGPKSPGSKHQNAIATSPSPATTPTPTTSTSPTLRHSGDADLFQKVKAKLEQGDIEDAQALIRNGGKRLTPEQRRELFADFSRATIAAKTREGNSPRPFGKGGRGRKFGKSGPASVGGDNDDWNRPPAPAGDNDDWDDPAPAPSAATGGKAATEAANAVTDALLGLDWPQAKEVLAKHKKSLTSTPTHKQQWEAASKAAALPQVILDSFRSQRGKTVKVQLKSGDTIQFIPESVATDGVTGRRLVRDGNTTGRIKTKLSMAELGVTERLKRLPPESDPIGAVMRGLVAIEAGRPDAAERLFGQHKADHLSKHLLENLKARLAEQAAITAKTKARQAASRSVAGKSKLTGAKPVIRPTPTSLSKLAKGSAEALERQTNVAKEDLLPIEIVDTLGIHYRLIPAGEFRRDDGATIRISRPFYMGKFEVTQKQWKAITGQNPSSEAGDDLPVDQVTWEQANRFAAALSGKLGVPEGTVRLPTEAEWEYACRAGTSGQTYYDAGRGKLEDFGNLLDASAPDKFQGSPIGIFKDRNSNDGNGTLAKVGKYRPNAFGLYDTYGNVFEWCSDWGGPYNAQDRVDPTGPPFGLFRIHRGGSFLYRSDFCNSTKRHQSPAKRYTGGQIAFGNALGLRLVREIN